MAKIKSIFVSLVVVGHQLDIVAGFIVQFGDRPELLSQYLLQCACLDFAVYPLATYVFFRLAKVAATSTWSSSSLMTSVIWDPH